MKAYRNTKDLPWDRRTKALVGKLLRPFFPSLAANTREHPFSREWGSLGRLMRNLHFHEAVKEEDHESLGRYLVDYWSSSASSEFFEQFSFRFESLFLKYHKGIVDEVASILCELSAEPFLIVELGSGDGRTLEYLSKNLKQASEFHGVDLNRPQIEACRDRYRDLDNVFFHHIDIIDWLNDHEGRDLLFFCNGGVLEYFTRPQLVKLFALLAQSFPKCAIALTESIAIDHDIDREAESFPYGHEFAFSHNYPAIINECGFHVCYQMDRLSEESEDHHPVRWLCLVAQTGQKVTVQDSSRKDESM